LDFADATFDAVVGRHGLMFADAPADAVREAARVLRPGGRYAAMVWAAREDNPWLGGVLDAVGEQFGVPFPPPGVAGPFALADPGSLEAALTEGGLREVRVRRLDTPMTVSSLEEWWTRVPRLAGPLAQALAGMPEADRNAIRDRALAKGADAARATGDGIMLAGAVLVAAGTVAT
jgi:SAM-dependent methyltransferase